MQRLLTERQYVELRDYEHGMPRWVNGGPMKSLVARGYIAASAHDPSMYAITQAGTSALAHFRERYGVPF